MTLRKLRLQARYNVLTPAALIGLTSALLMGAPAFAAAQTNTGNVPSILIGAGNAFTNTGTITTDNANPAVYSSTDIESFLNTGTGAIVGESYTGVDINGNVNGAFTNNGSISSTNEAGVDINGDVNGAFTNTGLISGSWAGVYVSGDVTGAFTNSGTLTAGYSYDA